MSARRRSRDAMSSVTVEIAGEKHVLRSDVPPEYTRSVAAYLDETIRSIPTAHALEPHRAAILAGLSVIDDLFRTREELRALREQVERRTAASAELLEEAAGDAGPPPRPTADG